MAKTLQFDDFAPQQNPNCAACEELLTDALDGLLSPADQAFFELHLDGCVPCMEKFAQAQRGAAWLELLKTHRPEPSAALMERILAQTTGQVVSSHNEFPAEIPAAITPLPTNVLPFIPRQAGVSRFTQFTRLAMEPRLAMTAAMAFFSIALTLNLTGVRFDQIHTADLKPSNLKRSYYEAKASAVRYSDNLRVVRVLESRVDDLRQANADDRPAQSAPSPEPKPQLKQQSVPEKKQDIPRGSSRRESPLPGPTLLRSNFTSTPDRLRHNASSAALSFKKEGGLA
jgi:hypothetical protein